MSFSFVRADSEGFYGEYASAPDRGQEQTVAFWFNTTYSASAVMPAGYYGGGSTHYWQIIFNGGLNYAYVQYGIYQVFASTSPGKYVVAANSSWYDGNWHLFVSTRNQTATSIYVDGVLQTKQAGSTNPGTASYFGKGLNGIGGQNRADINSINDFFEGKLAELAQWDVELTQAEINSLMHVSPLFVQPENLRSYVPLHAAVDEYGPFPQDSPNWTATSPNAPTKEDDHAPITYFQQPVVVTADFGGGGGGGGDSERRVKLVRDVTAGLTRNLSRNLYNFEAAPLGAG